MSKEANAERRIASDVFDADTTVEHAGDGLFAATVTARWNSPLGSPPGGYLAAICLRALAEVVPLADPLGFSAFFLRPGQVGPAEVCTQLVRVGKRTATGQASLVQSGEERLRLLSTFSDLRPRYEAGTPLNSPPCLPPPEDCIEPLQEAGAGWGHLAERLELRVAESSGLPDEKLTGGPLGEFWIRLAGGQKTDAMALALLVDSVPLAGLGLGEAGSVPVELTMRLRDDPSPGWLRARNSTRHRIGDLHEVDSEIWDSDGRLLAQSRRLAILHATKKVRAQLTRERRQNRDLVTYPRQRSPGARRRERPR